MTPVGLARIDGFQKSEGRARAAIAHLFSALRAEALGDSQIAETHRQAAMVCLGDGIAVLRAPTPNPPAAAEAPSMKADIMGKRMEKPAAESGEGLYEICVCTMAGAHDAGAHTRAEHVDGTGACITCARLRAPTPCRAFFAKGE